MKKFLMFDLMITPWIIRILYWVGQVTIIVVGFVTMAHARSGGGGGFHGGGGFGDINYMTQNSNHHSSLFSNLSMGGPVMGLLIIILGSLYLRILLEVLMVQFKICKNTYQIKEKIKEKNN